VKLLSDPLDIYVARWTSVYNLDLLPILSSPPTHWESEAWPLTTVIRSNGC